MFEHAGLLLLCHMRSKATTHSPRPHKSSQLSLAVQLTAAAKSEIVHRTCA